MNLVSASCNVLDQMSHPSWRRRADLSLGAYGLRTWRSWRIFAHARPYRRGPIVLPLSSFCSRSAARACSQAGPLRAEELETLLRLLGPPSERQRSDLRRATDIVLMEDGNLIYWPRTGEQFTDAAYAMARVQATLTA